MDISLNITNAPQPMRSKPADTDKPMQNFKKKTKNQKTNGFSFNFDNANQKVKAIVARKRTIVPKPNGAPIDKILPQSNSSKQPNNTSTEAANATNTSKSLTSAAVPAPIKKSIAIRRKAPPLVKNNRPSLVLAPKKSNTEDTAAAAKPPQPLGDNLMLNVFSAPAANPFAKPPALNRAERMKKKREERSGTITNHKLSTAELKAGLRKFSTNPNQKPRPADLYFQKERAAQPKQQEQLEIKRDENAENDNENTAIINKKPERPRYANDSSVQKVNLFQENPAIHNIGQRFVKPIAERLFDGTKVDSIGLHPHAVKNLADLLSITELTTVQKKTIPKALEGKDLLVRSQTGSGKTLAYALPIVEKLQEIRPKLTRDSGILAVVIVPTRELAIQTYELFQKLVKPFTWIVPGILMGGEKRKAEKARLRKGINILVGTPGRLVDHLLHTESFKLSQAKFLVLDEADRLLEMGYERDVKQIVEGIDKQRADSVEESECAATHLQRFLLSATLTAAVQKLAGLTLQEPLFIDNSEEDGAGAIRNANGYTKSDIEALTADLPQDDDDATGILTIPENLKLSYVVVPPKLRLVTLSGLLAKEYIGKQKFKAIVFMSTMEMVNYHNDLLNEALTQKVLDEDDEDAVNESDAGDDNEPLLKGLRFFKLHGSMSQTERQGVFKGFRECKSGVLLATDVVGRGIDVAEIDLVIQYSPPQKTADFVHRVGRTARAGRSGRAVLFLAPSEVQFVRNLEDRRIRIAQIDMYNYLNTLVEQDDSAKNAQEAASNLQHKFQTLINDDKELHDKACKAFVSWIKFYNTFPKELKPIFNVKSAHMGHFAKSFALKEEPKSFVTKHFTPKPAPPTNRLTYTERDPLKLQEAKQNKNNKKRMFATTVTGEVRNRNTPLGPAASTHKLFRLANKSKTLNVSEFDSGLPAAKKRKV